MTQIVACVSFQPWYSIIKLVHANGKINELIFKFYFIFVQMTSDLDFFSHADG